MTARHRAPKRKLLPKGTTLRTAVLAQCKAEVGALALPPLPRLTGGVPRAEVEAQKLYARARRALRALLAVAPKGSACGPCTAFVEEHRKAIEAFTRDAENGKGSHWRQHSADRTSATALTVDVYGSLRMTIGDRARALAPRELACVALMNGATLTGNSAEECIEAETRRIRAAQARNAKAPRIAVPGE